MNSQDPKTTTNNNETSRMMTTIMSRPDHHPSRRPLQTSTTITKQKRTFCFALLLFVVAAVNIFWSTNQTITIDDVMMSSSSSSSSFRTMPMMDLDPPFPNMISDNRTMRRFKTSTTTNSIDNSTASHVALFVQNSVFPKVQQDLIVQMDLQDDLLPLMEQIFGSDVVPSWEPIQGRHRSDQNVIMGVAQGLNYEQITLFVESLATVNYTGDLILCIDWEPPTTNNTKSTTIPQIIYMTQFWLTQYIPQKYPNMNLILYPTRYEPHYQPTDVTEEPVHKHRMMGTAKLFRENKTTTTQTTTTTLLDDPRQVRSFVQLRFEFMAVWARQYDTTSRIGIFDIHDVHFQRNPFEVVTPLSPIDWHFTKEFGPKLGATAPWVKWSWGRPMLDRLYSYPPINPGTMLGGRLAAEVYLRAMIRYFDVRGGKSWGWGEDQAHTTVMAYTGYLVNHTNVQFHVHKQFARDNPFTFLGIRALRRAKRSRTLVNANGEAVNGPPNDPVVIPIVHKGVPDPCQKAEEKRLKWIEEFKRYYQDYTSTKEGV